MAYLGINNNEAFNGLYYFSSVAMRDEIGKYFNDASFYYEKEKNKALAEMGISESEIKDGRILMNYYKNQDENAYLGITGTPYDGVYCFKRKVVRDREASRLVDVADTYMTMDKAEIMAKFGVQESEIRNGGFLMSGEVKNWLKKAQKKPEPKKKELVSVVSREEPKSITISSNNLLHDMLNVISKTHDIAEIRMINGEKYRVTIRPLFYTEEGFSFANTAVAGTSIPTVKGSVVDAMINSKSIMVLNASTIQYGDGYAVLTECDDEYSPNVHVNDDRTKTISHEIKNLVINVNQIVSVSGLDTYTELGLYKINREKNKLIYEYLSEKYV